MLSYISDGITLGLIYALVASGYSLIFSILRMINFSHGSIYAFSAMIALFLIGYMNPWIAMLISMALTGALAIALDKVCIEPLRKKNSPALSTLITTIGLSYVIQNALIMIWGSQRRGFQSFFDFGPICIGPLEISSKKLFVAAVAITLMGLLAWIINRTHAGLSIRAVQQNPKAASMIGVNVHRVILITFFIAGVSASIAGTLVAGYYGVAYPTMGVSMGNKTLASALLGGLGSMTGSLIGGVIVGVLESIVSGLLGPTYKDAVSFVLLILIMVIRPSGLLGKKNMNKV